MSSDLLAVLKSNPGDEEAWGELYRMMRPWVFSNAHQWLRDFADAEDVTQQTFMHLAHHWGRLTFSGWPELRSYLKRITVSRSIDLLRTRRSKPTTSAAEAIDTLASTASLPTPQSVSELLTFLDLSPEQQRQLSERQKQVLWLSFGGHTTREIADNTGVSPRTIRRDLAALRRAVRGGTPLGGENS